MKRTEIDADGRRKLEAELMSHDGLHVLRIGGGREAEWSATLVEGQPVTGVQLREIWDAIDATRWAIETRNA